MAIGGFLADYSGKRFEAAALDLGQWSQWCLDHEPDLCGVRSTRITSAVSFELDVPAGEPSKWLAPSARRVLEWWERASGGDVTRGGRE